MTFRCVLAPAGSGKTFWIVRQARASTPGLEQDVWIVVPSRLLAEDLKIRLAGAGGAFGVQVGTLQDLARRILETTAQEPLLLSEHIQASLVRGILVELPLDYYRAIQDKGGFVQESLGVIRELQAGGVTADRFQAAVEQIAGGPRLSELALIYQEYSRLLHENSWADPARYGWMAAEAVAADPKAIAGLGAVFLDGFDDLSPIQLELVVGLANQGVEVTISLTGDPGGEPREIVHKRFLRLQGMLQLHGCQLEHLQEIALPSDLSASAVRDLERSLFGPGPGELAETEGVIEMAAVPDREAEVRTALRWIRHKILQDGIQPGGAAILTRSLESYRDLIVRIAHEYDLPVRMQGGLPLMENPAVAALWDLLKMVGAGRGGMIWHEVVALWRSPYLDWESIFCLPGDGYTRDTQLVDAKLLEEIARWGRVIRGYEQWQEAFHLLSERLDASTDEDSTSTDFPGGFPDRARTERLGRNFELLAGLTDHAGLEAPIAEHIAWIEELLGLDDGDDLQGKKGILKNILAGPAELLPRDWSAVRALCTLFQDLITADRMLQGVPVSFGAFLDDLESALQRASYQPWPADRETILCADCTEARGLSFQAVALLGLAEGEFPAVIKEDPFLRDQDRAWFRDLAGLPIRPSLDSAEAEYFYESITRTSRYLLLTRPRIADNGAPWLPSPYWEEIERLTGIEPQVLTSQSWIPLEAAASKAEYLEAFVAAGCLQGGQQDLGGDAFGQDLQQIQRASDVVRSRSAGAGGKKGVYNGDLSGLSDAFARRYPAAHIWSASRLETYQACPHMYFVRYLLGLDMPEDPAEGLDSRQLGNIYHHILEDLYSRQGQDYRLRDLLDQLPSAAAPVFREAPRREVFRETAWWDQTQEEILANLRLSLIELERMAPEFRFHSAEQRFGISPNRSAVLEVEVEGEGKFLLHGLIDRVDLNAGGSLRIVDYKTSNPSSFSAASLREGTKLQLPLYALAAEKALNLGKVQEGFYFHLLSAQPSGLRLSAFADRGQKGPQAAMETASRNGWQAVHAIREGKFAPNPPDEGCPSYCPAAGFCWQYKAKTW